MATERLYTGPIPLSLTGDTSIPTGDNSSRESISGSIRSIATKPVESAGKKQNILEGKDFIRVTDKVKQPNRGNDSAWEEAQPMLANFVEGYPEQFQDFSDLIRFIFTQRRDAYLGKVIPTQASQEIMSRLSELTTEEDEKLRPLVVCVRDIFNRPSQSSMKRNSR